MRGRELPAGNRINLENASFSEGFSATDFDIIFPNVANQYMDWIILLFMGGFILAVAVFDNHIERNPVAIINPSTKRCGCPPIIRNIFNAILLCRFHFSTATALMLMPMGMSLVLLYEELNKDILKKGGKIDPRADNFSLTLLLGIAYGASIGGFATLIGTPPNGILTLKCLNCFQKRQISHLLLDAFRAAYEFYIHDDCLVLLTRVVFLSVAIPFSGKEFIQSEIKN